ncbi:proton myo-inositol cotransporter-like [Homarus americanus]|uniref:proton myo-inositol cotransporter-like n=1 Tax=Homarus americanus TaxID=6706 RepID=UPI001C463B73|nr:proton myo-inositol cotransporter-like [Homarus americanus]XP_042215001.1 proton myo-inositol cotransporter-like [Homarus americanus]
MACGRVEACVGEMGVSRTLITLTIITSLSGFLNGYDSIMIAACMIFIREELKLTTMWHQVIVGTINMTGVVVVLLTGQVTERVGRWKVIVASSVFFVVASVTLASAGSITQLIVARVFFGVSLGIATMIVPVYISESSPTAVRGRIAIVFNLMYAVGQLIASLVGGAFSTVPHGWRYISAAGSLPALIQFIGLFFLPESPRWLFSQGRVEEATDALKTLRAPHAPSETEINAIQVDIRANAGKGGLFMIFKSVPVRRALLIGTLLHIAQPLTGCFAILNYSATIITMTGVADKNNALWFMAAIISGSAFGFIVNEGLVERLGRRPLVLASLMGIIIAFIIVGITFQMAYLHSPTVQAPSGDPECLANTCGECTSKKECGFCYKGAVGSEHDTSCMAADPHSYFQVSVAGSCSNATLIDAGVETFAYDWCPYRYSWIILIGLSFFFFVYYLGMGPLPWVIASEVFPSWARSTSVSLVVTINWLINFAVITSFLTLTETIFKYGVFYLLMGINFMFLAVFYFLLPETSGISLEDMEKLFNKPIGTVNARSSSRVDPN